MSDTSKQPETTKAPATAEPVAPDGMIAAFRSEPAGMIAAFGSEPAKTTPADEPPAPGQ